MIVLSFIIVNYNTCLLTSNCIESILNLKLSYSYEIIVVDNASTDDSLIVLSKRYPCIRIVKNDKNWGFGKANNIGATVATGKYLFLLNSDTIMYKDVCKSLMDFYEQHQYLNIGVLGINLLNSENKASHSYGNFPRSFKTEHRKRNIITSVETYSLVDVIIGADMFIPKDLFLAFGGFDENIFLYEEEMEFQYRLNINGYYSYLLKMDGIIHLEGKSSDSYFKRICSFRSMCYIHKKHLSLMKYYKYRMKWLLYSIFFLKNTHISFGEKLNYLMFVCTYRLK